MVGAKARGVQEYRGRTCVWTRYTFHLFTDEIYVSTVTGIGALSVFVNVTTSARRLLLWQFLDAVGWELGRQEGHPACKKLSGGMLAWLCAWGADLHIAQQMPLTPTISCSSKSRLVLPSWFYLSGTCWPGWTRTYSRPAVKRLCVCVCCVRTYVRTYGRTDIFTGFIRSSLRRWPKKAVKH